jgi:hypothetical protein
MTFCRTNPVVRRLAPLIALTFFLSTVDWTIFAAPVSAASPREDLTKAEDYFLVADFATALDRVETLIGGGGLEGGILRDAYVLQARCQVALAHRSAAVDAYCNALRVDPGWRPDADFFTKDEIEVFDQAKGSCSGGTSAPKTSGSGDYLPPPTSRSKPWYKNWKIVGPVAAGVVILGVVLLSGGGDDESTLDDFPPPPSN